MAKTNERGDWIDGLGNAVPKKYVKPVDRERDKLVERTVARAKKLNAALAAFRAAVDAEIEEFLGGEYAKAGAKRNEGGNYQLTNFSGDQQVEVKICAFLGFDEKLQIALAILEECGKRWSQETRNDNLRVAINEAFARNKRGFLDTKRILGLRRWAIKDAEWDKAMNLITESVKIESRRAYIQIRERGPDGSWEAISLDLSRV